MRLLRQSPGFTLVEMLVVLSLVALLAALCLPYSTSSGAAQQLDAVTQIVAAKLREVQTEAIATNRERRIALDVKNGRVMQLASNKTFVLPKGSLLHIVTAENDVVANVATMRFFADGGSTGGKITISRGSLSREIAVNWLTGAVVVSRGRAP